MIKEKNIKVGKVNLMKWDWFEACKFLSMLAGMSAVALGWGLSTLNDPDKMAYKIMFIVLNIGLIFVLGSMINIIRDMNPDNGPVKVVVNDD